MLELLKQLPMEIVTVEIFKFLNGEQLLFTNKKHYESHIINYRFNHNKFSYKNAGIGLDNYIKKILLHRYHYIFSLIIKYKYDYWIKSPKYRYNGYRYENYIDFLEQLCYKLNSTKCRNALLKYEKDNKQVRKKKYKKMRSFINRWNS